MMLLLLAALPTVFWDAPPDTAQSLRDAGIERIVVPAEQIAKWQGVTGITVERGDKAGTIVLKPPAVNYRINQGGATRAPWLVANGGNFVRTPRARFYYEVKGSQSATAAAEAFMYGVPAMIQSDAAGLKPLGEMLHFLAGLPAADPAPIADIGFIDDGTPDALEVMGLLVRDNLMFKLVPKPDSSLKLNVQIGTKDYPREEAKNPGLVAKNIRFKLTDEKRSLRIYGSQVVLGRLTGTRDHVRLELLNYAAGERGVDGLRIRVLGKYTHHTAVAAGAASGVKVVDYTVEDGATELTLAELKTFAVIDLSR